MPATVIDGKALAAATKAEAAEKVRELKSRGINPCLAVILVGENPASQVYVRGKINDCAQCGIESRSDGDGNEKKGEASDAFKRAGFRWGIGRELYTAPFVFATLPTEKQGAGYRLAGTPKFRVDEIAYQDDAISRLRIMCETRNTETEVFRFGMQGAPQRKSPSPAAQPTQPTQPAQPTRIVQGQMDYIRAVCSEAEIQAILRKQKLERLEDMLFEKAKRVVEQLQQKGR